MRGTSSSQATRLLLVYNADGGIVSMVKDAIHKVVSPATYPCSLCAITYGPVSMHGDWRRFLDSLPIDVVFHHKDDFGEAYPDHGIALPVVLVASNDDKPQVLVSADELDETQGTTELIALVEDRLTAEYLHPRGLNFVA